MVTVVNTLVVLAGLGAAAVVAYHHPGPRRTRRRFGWGMRLGPFFFWRR